MDLSPTEVKTEEASRNEEATKDVALEPLPESSLQMQSPFMKLPLGLRLEIYRLVLVAALPVQIPTSNQNNTVTTKWN